MAEKILKKAVGMFPGWNRVFSALKTLSDMKETFTSNEEFCQLLLYKADSLNRNSRNSGTRERQRIR